MTKMQVPLTRPVSGPEELAAVAEVIASGWWTQGPKVGEFERFVADYIGVDHAIATTSCTTALHIALILLGVGPGDEVIIPSYTWIATANVVLMVGAKPVFVDIDLNTFNITAAAIEAAITDKTRLIMPVHQFGLPADLDAITAVAARNELPILEDAACAIGSCYKGQPIGSLGHMTCLSFHPRKVVSTGEGGMILTNNADYAARARSLINHGASVSDVTKHKEKTVKGLQEEQFPELGYNYRLTNMQGAMGVVQMERLDHLLAERIRRAEFYNKALAEIPHIIPPQMPSYAQSSYQSYMIRIADSSPVPMADVAQHLLDNGVACRPGYMACHIQPLYREMYPDLALPNTEKALETSMVLPLFPEMTQAEQTYVVEQLAAVLS